MQPLATRTMTRSLHLGVLLPILACCAVAQTSGTGAVEVRNLGVSRDGNLTRIEVTLSDSVTPSIETATQPDRLVLVLPNTVSSGLQRRIAVNDNGIHRVRMGLNSAQPPVTKIVVDLDEARPYALTPKGNKVVLTVRPAVPITSRAGLVRASDHSPASEPAENAGTPSASSASDTSRGQQTGSVANFLANEKPAAAEAPKQVALLAAANPPQMAGEPESKAIPSSEPGGTTPLSEGHYERSPIPVVTGFMAFQSSFAPGEQHVNPVFDPLILLPLGDKLLIESEFEMNLDVVRGDGQWGPAAVDHGIEYLQLNYIAHPNLTITAGRFLTPFGIYRERVHPLWVRNLQEEPIIFAMNENSSNGAMLRGAASLSPKVNLTYAGYYSIPTSWKLMTSDRRAGGRASLFFPNQRIEIGASFSRTLGDLPYNMFGMDATWNLKKIPLDIRAEGLRNAVLGSGYWVEGAYRLNKLGSSAFLRKSQVVLRGEQYFAPGVAPMGDMAEDAMSELPDRNTKRVGIGWNYYLTNGIRLNTSFGRNFAFGENGNTWGAGITYRFATF